MHHATRSRRNLQLYSAPRMNTILSVVAGIVSAALVLKMSALSEAQIIGAGQSIAGLCGTIFGALVAALAILTAVMDRPLMANMRKTGHWSRLLNNTLVVCALMLGASALAIVTMFVAAEHREHVLAGAIALAVTGVGLLFKTGYRYRQVIKHL